MENLYTNIVKGIFLDRPNRFICHVQVNGEVCTCHMPNPGRMRELLFRGVTVYLTKNRPGLRTSYRVIGIEKGNEGNIFFLDTAKANDVAARLVMEHKIPGWESYSLLGREITMGDSRFDLLLGNRETGEVFPVEVKSCSLAGEKGAMFPDAPTERGKKHLDHLLRMSRNGEHAGLLILVHYSKAEWFLPDFHTDIDFAKSFRQAMDFIDWKAAVIVWSTEFTMPESVRLIESSERVLDEEMGDRGNYLVILYADADKTVEDGNCSQVQYRKGYYVYVGNASAQMNQKMKRYKTIHKQKKNHMDYLREECVLTGIIPIRSKTDLTGPITLRIAEISDWKVTHSSFQKDDNITLFGFSENPMHIPEFLKIEEDFEINRLQSYFSNSNGISDKK